MPSPQTLSLHPEPNLDTQTKRARAIAFYLPQFHPIPENNEWWGAGFTEWTNVAKAKPLFHGHSQPNIPADLGFYDLRLPESRSHQARLAKEYGVEGFCYWHYWFGEGRQVLERPFEEVLASGEPDLPFCLAWANQSWTGIWYGAPRKTLLEQTYPGEEDYRRHFYHVLRAFRDKRYITVEGKPLFVIWAPDDLPDCREFTSCWRRLAAENGLPGLYLVAFATESWDPSEHGFDASIVDSLHSYLYRPTPWKKFKKSVRDLITRLAGNSHDAPHSSNTATATARALKHVPRRFSNKPRIGSYEKLVGQLNYSRSAQFTQYLAACCGWDNTPRSGASGVVLRHATPALWEAHLGRICDGLQAEDPEKRLLFIRSWNEWAEGNYLEPDQRQGHALLESVKRVVSP
jgi:hypothetical protein